MDGIRPLDDIFEGTDRVVDLVALYRLLVKNVPRLLAIETDERRELEIAFDVENPATRATYAGVAGRPSTGAASPDKPVLLDPLRAARNRIECDETDARGSIVHVEFTAHTELLRHERDDRRIAQTSSIASHRRACDRVDRLATYGVVDLLAEATVAYERLEHVERLWRQHSQRVSDTRRAIEADERAARDALEPYAMTGLSAILRVAFREQEPLLEGQRVHAAAVQGQRLRDHAAQLLAVRLQKERDERLEMALLEEGARRTLRRVEASAAADISKLLLASVTRLARNRSRPSVHAALLSASQSTSQSASFHAP
jgi:hypothetical protein